VTFGQLVLGLITLTVATFVYRWQKSVDRVTVSQVELRKLMSAYAALSHRLFLKQPYFGVEYSEAEINDFFSISDEEIELYTLRDQLYVCAPTSVLDSVLICDRKFRDWKMAFPKNPHIDEQTRNEFVEIISEFKFAHERMLAAMRNELVGQNKLPWPEWLQKIWTWLKEKLTKFV
jgi:hypothetical protein